jgi:hypothetical protein
MAASARVAYLARRANDYGVQTGRVKVNLAQVRERKQKVVERFRNGAQMKPVPIVPVVQPLRSVQIVYETNTELRNSGILEIRDRRHLRWIFEGRASLNLSNQMGPM